MTTEKVKSKFYHGPVIISLIFDTAVLPLLDRKYTVWFVENLYGRQGPEAALTIMD